MYKQLSPEEKEWLYSQIYEDVTPKRALDWLEETQELYRISNKGKPVLDPKELELKIANELNARYSLLLKT